VARANQMEERITAAQNRLNLHGEFLAKIDRRLDELEQKVILLTPPPPKAP
jgi:hypothetical protein